MAKLQKRADKRILAHFRRLGFAICHMNAPRELIFIWHSARWYRSPKRGLVHVTFPIHASGMKAYA